MHKPTVGAVIVIVLGYPATAMAYIDPTAGGLLLQLLLGGLAGLGVVVRLYWDRLKEKFTNKRREK